MRTAPIALFVYNRLEHARKTIESLRRNTLARESDLKIFSDGPKSWKEEGKVAAIREYIRNVKGFSSVEIFESRFNRGLAGSIIDGVTHVLTTHENIIVLEDDLVTSPFFLDFLNQGLNLYEHNAEVISLHGYVYPVKARLPETFFLKGADCWGWATWRRGWQYFNPEGRSLLNELEARELSYEFDFWGSYPYTRMLRDQIRGANDSWAIRWYASAFLNNKLTLYPGRSLVNNIGHDLTGTHSTGTDRFHAEIATQRVALQKLELKEDNIAKQAIAEYFRETAIPFHKKVFQKLRGMMR